MPTYFQTLLLCCIPYIYILVLPCGFLILPGSYTDLLAFPFSYSHNDMYDFANSITKFKISMSLFLT